MKKIQIFLVFLLTVIIISNVATITASAQSEGTGVSTQTTGTGSYGGGVSTPTTGTGASSGGVSNPTTSSNSQSSTFTLQNPLNSKITSLGALVQNFVVIFSYIAILFAVLVLIYIGFRYVLAQGNPAEMSKLSTWLGWTVVGIAIIIGARLIIQVVINTLSSTGTIDQNVLNSASKAAQGN